MRRTKGKASNRAIESILTIAIDFKEDEKKAQMTVALDPCNFESPDFDPSKWVDSLCSSRPEEQSMEK